MGVPSVQSIYLEGKTIDYSSDYISSDNCRERVSRSTMRKRPERQLNAILLLGMRFIDNLLSYLLYR